MDRYYMYTTINKDTQYIIEMINNITDMAYIILPKSLLLQVFQICDNIIINNIINSREDLNIKYNYYYMKKKDLPTVAVSLVNDTDKLNLS